MVRGTMRRRTPLVNTNCDQYTYTGVAWKGHSQVSDGRVSEAHKDDPILPIYRKIKELGGWPVQEDMDDQYSNDHLIDLVRNARGARRGRPLPPSPRNNA